MIDSPAKTQTPVSQPITDLRPPRQSYEEWLEQGKILCFRECPFAVPSAEDCAFLYGQQLGAFHKNITYDPATKHVSGFRRSSQSQTVRLTNILRTFADQANDWLRQILPGYATRWHPDRASFRSEEEATRKLRLSARNDLIHVDAFPTRPAGGARLLRLFLNIHPTDPRVWVTSKTFPELFRDFGELIKGKQTWSVLRPWSLLQDQLRSWWSMAPRTNYDKFMLRFHHFLKSNDTFQEKCPKRFWKFPPGAVWVAFTDSLSHAVLRGQFALEHSFFVGLDGLVMPELAPATILGEHSVGQNGVSHLRQAA
ncbi:MAG: Kdo hydroxylase family protein [Gemmataceae bacterium]